MKKDLSNLYNDEVDKLLFDYLEGSLPKESAADLEDKLAFNTTLQEELKHWKESFVEEEFYDTSLLEEQLQQKIISDIRYTTESYILIVALFTSFLSFMPFTFKKEKMQSREVVETLIHKKISAAQDPEAMPDHKIESGTSEIQVTAVKDILNKVNPSKFNPFTEQEEDKIKVEFIKPLPAEGIFSNSTILLDETNVKELHVANKKTNNQKQTYSSKISRKDQRAIERAKEKALQKRLEEKYMRGRKPYVVPLNPNF